MANVVPVLDLLVQLVGTHKFGSSIKDTSQSNCERRIEKKTVIRCRDGNRITIPEGTSVVIYRHPLTTWDKRLKIACFHHPDAKRQTIIYASGKGRTQDLDQTAAFGGRRKRAPRHDTLSHD